jgi:uncharacterized protein (DUF1697 family)
MKTYIALLRGINVSGHKLIKMADLKSYLTELNFKNIRTYIQSGNVIFEYETTKIEVLEHQIKQKILEKYHFEVPTILVTPEVIKSIIDNNPFANEIENTFVIFLSHTPFGENIEKLQQVDYSQEKYIIIGKTIYLNSPKDFAKNKLSIHLFEKKLKVNATTRNWNTLQKLLELSDF